MSAWTLRTTLVSSVASIALACSAGDGSDPDESAGGAESMFRGGSSSAGTSSAPSGGSNARGGTANGSGASFGSGGATQGFAGATSGGGTSGAGTSGGASSSGASNGGASTSGGTGGGLAMMNGGTSSGGTSAGGAMNGVSGAGGRSTGGAINGGASSGGAAGAKSSGGANGTGGASAGASGKASGGNQGSGGNAGTPGLGPWTNGYVATMYGDISAGDCASYAAHFTDHTPIKTYTCVDGTGPRKVTLSSYSSGVANNASYYAALGDLSSLWTANGNASACTCSGSTTMTCGGPQCPSEISATGACGLCVAVKCDASSTFKDNQGYSHNSSCNSTTYVVVQNIDACPHNHTTNVSSGAGWCTDRQAQHIDLSCSGLGDISNLGVNVGQAGWLPVSVQVVDCSVGLGKHSL